MGRRESHVLLVEDSPGDARLVCEYLTDAKSEQFNVHPCDRLDSALAYVADSAVDVVLLDLGLPDSQGLDTFRRMRDAVRGTPIVVLTGNVDQALALSAVGEGAQDYLVKGEVTSDSLARSIRYAVARRVAADEIRESEERFRTLYENATIGLYRTAPDGTIILANPALVRMLGFSSSDELLVRNLDADGFEPSYPRSQFLERIEKEGTVKALEAAWTRRDGTTLIVRESARAIRDSDGKTLFYDGTVEDITARRQAEEALRVKDFAIESAITAMAISDLAGTLAYVNPAFVRLWGFESAAEVVGRSIAEFSGSPEKATGVAEAVRTQGGWLGEEVIRTREGTLVEVRMMASLVVDAVGQPICMLASFEDISERKRAEEVLRESETRFRELFRQMSSGVAVYEAIDDGGDFVFRDFNPAAEMIEGKGRTEVIGRRVSEAFPGVKALGAFDVFHRVWQTGKPEHLPAAMYEDARLPTSWRETWAYRLPTGEIVAIYNDVTERKRAEERLKSQLEELRRWETVMLDREDRVREIKHEVNELCRRVGEDIRYRSEEAQ